MSDFDDVTFGKWEEILPRFGCSSEYLKNKHGPCPLCGGGKDRFRFDDRDGRGTWICNQCGAGTGLQLVAALNGWDIRVAMKEVLKVAAHQQWTDKREPSKHHTDPMNRISAILSKTSSVKHGDPVDLYLRSRGITPNPSLRCHSSLPYWEAGKITGTFPAMVGEIKTLDGSIVSLHLTYLRGQGKAPVQIPRKMLPAVGTIKGASVHLTELCKTKTLCITEGIETGIAVWLRTGHAVWAALSAGGMESIEVPDNIDHIKIYGDNDSNFVGQHAAYGLAKRIGKRASVHIPSNANEDWLNVYQRMQKTKAA